MNDSTWNYSLYATPLSIGIVHTLPFAFVIMIRPYIQAGRAQSQHTAHAEL